MLKDYLQLHINSTVCHHSYLQQLFLSVLVSELHVEDFPLQAAHEFHLWALSLCSFLQILQQPGQLKHKVGPVT